MSTVDVTKIVNAAAISKRVMHSDVSSPGPQGAVGPQGPPSQPAEFIFSSPSMSWVVTHNQGRYPVPVILVGGLPVDADVVYNDTNSFTVTFMAPQSGKVEI